MSRRTSRRGALALVILGMTLPGEETLAQEGGTSLPFPGLLKKAEREAGNPLATYAAMLALDEQYRASKVFAGIYPEVRLNYEEFLGLPFAGLQAMSLPALRTEGSKGEKPIPAEYQAQSALVVIARMAQSTRLVIFGEEHHLPQTRSLYEPMLRELWRLGYRYLAAETFTDDVMAKGFEGPRYVSGYYLMDPVYAAAIRTANRLGYQLVAYDTEERGPSGDASFRDRTQAENLEKRIFARDPQAKALILAGRGHAAEMPPPDGWTPMASVLKQRTGFDPFTIYAPTMSARQSREEEDPQYRAATAHGLVAEPTIFVDEKTGRCFGSGNCDAYVFWPRFALENGRPDWMTKSMGRRAVPIPEELLGGQGLRLAQAFLEGEKETMVPIDQVLLQDGAELPALMLPQGSFWVRVIDAMGNVTGPALVDV
jgi:hypothetical protein